MKTILGLAWVLSWFGAVLNNFAADAHDAETGLVRTSNAWKENEPVPTELLKYRTSWIKGNCFPDPEGTEVVFGGITNYLLLKKIVFLPKIDFRVFSNAVNRAILVGGPNSFFRDLTATLKDRPEFERQDRIKLLKKQSKERHMIVDSLYISFADMPSDSARKVLDEISVDLRAGKPWHDVYWRFMEKYESPNEDKLGAIIPGTRSKIGNLGDFLLTANHNALFLYREDWLPKQHFEKILTSNTGDIVILYDKEDLSRFPDLAETQSGERYVLYHVREVFDGM